MSAPKTRRGFLRGLTTLPLIGGGVALIGSPTAVAEPITDQLLDGYDAWLEYERRWLQWERNRSADMAYRLNPPFIMQMMDRHGEITRQPADYVPCTNGGASFHGGGEPPASTRAALVLSAVGCDWRRGRL